MKRHEEILYIEPERLVPFRNHPFRVTMDEDMEELIDSIRSYGILDPLIVRPTDEGNYEIISGHRRKYAATVIGLLKVPVIIRYMSDDLAVLSMVDTNLRREKLPPSEKATAYRMKYEALRNLRQQYGRKKADRALSGRSVDLLSNKTGDSPKQVQRYVRLSYLIPDLSYLLDQGELGLTPGYEFAFLPEDEQRIIARVIAKSKHSPSLAQAMAIKEASKGSKEKGGLTNQMVRDILLGPKNPAERRIILNSEQLRDYFPENCSPEMMKEGVLKIMQEWAEKQDAGNSDRVRNKDQPKGSAKDSTDDPAGANANVTAGHPASTSTHKKGDQRNV